VCPVKSNPTRESNAKTPPLYPFQLSPNALKPESYAILRLILVRNVLFHKRFQIVLHLLKALRGCRDVYQFCLFGAIAQVDCNSVSSDTGGVVVMYR
jgi:hypothetical protein